MIQEKAYTPPQSYNRVTADTPSPTTNIIYRVRQVSYNASATGSRTLYTVPDGYIARLTYFLISFIEATSLAVNFKVDDVTLWYAYEGAGTDLFNTVPVQFVIDVAPVITKTVKISTGAVGSKTVIVQMIILEQPKTSIA